MPDSEPKWDRALDATTVEAPRGEDNVSPLPRRPFWAFPTAHPIATFLACVVVGLALVPRWLCGREADTYFEGEIGTQRALADHVARAVENHPSGTFYGTGNLRFDGQSAVAIYQMTVMGLAQVVLEHPELRDRYLPTMEHAARQLAAPATLRYAASVYGRHGVDGMSPGAGHAYLGYINLGLGMLRAVHPATELAPLHDHLTEQLAQRLDRAPHGLIETYPGETWPPDVAAAAGSIGLHARATGRVRSALLERWSQRFARCAVDASGYLVQEVRTGTCEGVDAPRGSGTAVAAYFLGFATPDLAKRLEGALRTEGRRTLFGFSALREYARGFMGDGDVNAGPILFGVSVGPTGFGLGAARLHGDRELFRELFRTLYLFGTPVDTGGERTYAVGGTLGNALLLAMLTARTPDPSVGGAAPTP